MWVWRTLPVRDAKYQVAGWLTNVQRKQLPFATAGALTDTAFDVRKHVVEKTFPRVKRTASGKVGAAKRPRAVLGKPNTFIRRTSSGGQILQKGPAQERAAQDALSASTAGAHTEAAALLRRRGQGGAAADGAEL